MLLAVTHGDRRGGSARGVVRGAPRPVTVSSRATVGVPLERETELGRVDHLLERVDAGVGAIVVVDGPAGIGKSRLLAAIRERAQAHGFGVLAARGSEFEAEIAFGVVRQLFEPMLRTAASSERRRLLEGVARIGARALSAEPGEPPADRFAAIHGLFWLCANRAERGALVVLVDDVQWADNASLAWLGYLARRAEDLAVMAVLGLRSSDPGGERGELEGMMEDRGVERLTLGPLSASAVGAIVRRQLGEEADEQFCATCYELTRGNPLFVRELLVAAGEEGLCARADNAEALHRIAPKAIGPSVLARLRRLGSEAVALARAVAVLGAGAEVVLAAALADMNPVMAELAADRLAAAQILASSRPLEFFHPLIGAAVYADIPLGARRVAHRRAAHLIDREGERSVARTAAHLLSCGAAGDRWVVEVLHRAAREAVASGAPESASSYLERALGETQPPAVRAELLLELGEAQLQAGLPGATERIREALDFSTDPHRRTEICLALGRARFSAGDSIGAREAFRDGVAEVPDGDADLALELHHWCVTVGLEGLPAMVGERLRALVDDDSPGRTRIERVLLAHLAFESARSGARAHDEVARLALRALAHGALLQDGAVDLVPHFGACLTLVYADETDAAVAELDNAVESSQRRGSPVAFAWFSRLRGLARFYRGELLEALADLESSNDAYRDGHAQGLPGTRALLALCLIERDDLTAAARALVLPGDTAEWRSQPFFVPYLYAVARLRAEQERRREALDTLVECGQMARAMNLVNPAASLPWRSEAALLATGLGERARAAELLAEELSLARAFGAPRALGAALRAAGLIDRGKGGLEQLGLAVAILDGSGTKLELARTRTDYGAALRRAGYRAQARVELERALDGAHHCGARRIAARARAELIAAGAKARRDAITGRDALTASELRVARLAAQGLTNREIAQALFITTKTAKAHLNRIYRKLEIRRRGQLAVALTGGLDDSHEQSANAAAAIS
jgi:DNA-binding CsgD family transcriptional regulator